jgi:ElaB/YqjD/DUF883 family membrane-anchored ribosome-binding protein
MGKDPADLKSLESVEQEVDTLRARTEALLEELERRIEDSVDGAKRKVERIKHAVDLPAQAREHPGAATGIGAGTGIAIGVGLWLLLRRRRQSRLLVPRMRRRAEALRLLFAEPERALRRSPPLGRKLFAAALVAVVGALARRLAERAARPLLPA